MYFFYLRIKRDLECENEELKEADDEDQKLSKIKEEVEDTEGVDRDFLDRHVVKDEYFTELFKIDDLTTSNYKDAVINLRFEFHKVNFSFNPFFLQNGPPTWRFSRQKYDHQRVRFEEASTQSCYDNKDEKEVVAEHG
tara:strand:+ start:3315 stop:3728 length:414 start_codon:yes stop_codon:yes gene_type:complete